MLSMIGIRFVGTPIWDVESPSILALRWVGNFTHIAAFVSNEYGVMYC